MNAEPTVENLLKQLIEATKVDRASVLKQTEMVLEFVSGLVAQSVDDAPRELRPMKDGTCVRNHDTSRDEKYTILGVDEYGIWVRLTPRTKGFIVSPKDFKHLFIVVSEPEK